MTGLQLASLLIVLAGAFGTINYLFLKLPAAIGILVVALLASFAVLGIDALLPAFDIASGARKLVDSIAFSDALLEGMLGLLLFAGALHLKLADLRRHWMIVTVMATAGVALSTVVIGLGFAWIAGAPLIVALVFGALISPTDPVAVLGVLRGANLPKSFETRIAGESLFNDGVGYVLFLVLVGIAFPEEGHGGGGLGGAALLFLREAVGGAALGIALGFLVFRLLRRIDDYALEVLLTLGLAFGGYELALFLHVSAPIMAVCAGLLIGDIGARHGMSDETRNHVDAFWRLIDEILNAVLFLIIGFEVFALSFDLGLILTGLAAIPLALAGRFVAVAGPIMALRPFRNIGAGVTRIMTWGGLKGGISVALALSLPEGEWKPLILTATYLVVVFSIVVQGLTISGVARRAGSQQDLV